MEGRENIELDNFGDTDIQIAEQGEYSGYNDTDFNIKPGNFSYDILHQRLGMSYNEVKLIGMKNPEYFEQGNTRFFDAVLKNIEIRDRIIANIFKNSIFNLEPEYLKTLTEMVRFSKNEQGELVARLEGRKFFRMEQDGTIKFYKKDGMEYVRKTSGETVLNSTLLGSFKVGKDIITNKGRLNAIKTAKTIVNIAKNEPINKPDINETVEKFQSEVKQIIEDGKDDELNLPDVPNDVTEFVDFDNSKVRGVSYTKEGNIRINNMTVEEFEKMIDREEEKVVPLKLRLRELFKKNGLTIASITMAVGSIISSIAISLKTSALSLSSSVNSAKLNKEISKLREENERLKKEMDKNIGDNKDMKEEMDKNDKKINDRLDKLESKKSISDYIKQIASFILSSLSTLVSFIGKIVKSAGKALMGLGWIVYIIIAALVALAYGYDRK